MGNVDNPVHMRDLRSGVMKCQAKFWTYLIIPELVLPVVAFSYVMSFIDLFISIKRSQKEYDDARVEYSERTLDFP